MDLFKTLQMTFIVTAIAVLAFATPARAQFVTEPFGACVGDATHDCVTTTGHISASVVGTLSVNEERAVSFGNMAVTCPGGGCVPGTAMFTLGLDGTRGADAGGIVKLHGAQANDGAANHAGAVNSGAQQAGHYTVTGVETAATNTLIYVSFADNAGNRVDYSGEDYYTANDDNIILANPDDGAHTFTVDDFIINEAGSDVYGHYVTSTNAGTIAPGIGNPFDPATHVAGTGLDVVVGATIHANGAAGAFGAGKYVGTYNVMVSY